MGKGIEHKDVGDQITYAEYHADDAHELASGTSFPGSPSEGDLFYRTDEHKWYVYNGTSWLELTSQPPAPFWNLLTTLSPSNTTSINTGTITARDLWKVVIDIHFETGGPVEAQVNMRFNQCEIAYYRNRYVDGTTIIYAEGETVIRIGTLGVTNVKYPFTAVLYFPGKTLGTDHCQIPVTGVVGTYPPDYNVILNSAWYNHTADITRMDFLFGSNVTGKISIFCHDN